MSAHRLDVSALDPYRKAIVAFLTPGLAMLAPTLVVGDLPTGREWLAAFAVSALVSLGVYVVPNRTS